jgi:hypothetical protein
MILTKRYPRYSFGFFGKSAFTMAVPFTIRRARSVRPRLPSLGLSKLALRQ